MVALPPDFSSLRCKVLITASDILAIKKPSETFWSPGRRPDRQTVDSYVSFDGITAKDMRTKPGRKREKQESGVLFRLDREEEEEG